MRVYRNLNGLRTVLKYNWEGNRGIKSRNQDCVTIITGAEGIGKSNLLLWMYEIWTTELVKNEISDKDIQNIGDNKKTFIQALYGAKKNYMIAHDEAGKDLYARDAMSTFNRSLNKAYIVIRGLNLHTVFVVPNILDLETYFRNHRVKQMLHVYDFGKYCVFDKKAINQLLPRMKRAKMKNEMPNPGAMGVKPFCYDTFPIYENKTMLDPYLQRKDENMKGVVQELYDEFVEEKQKYNKYKSQRDILIKSLKNDHNLTQTKIAKILGMTQAGISAIILDMEKQ